MTRVAGIELPAKAHRERFAIPAFNVSTMEMAQGVLAAAETARAPVYLQLSPGALAYAGYDTLTRLVMDLADRAAVPVIVHLDHARDLDVIRRALADGYGSVMVDGSTLSFEDNIRLTSAVLDLAAGTRAGVEAEIGVVGGSEDWTIEDARRALTSPDEALEFVTRCPVTVLAAAFGTLHRMPDDAVAPDVALIGQISAATGKPLALHGGSGVERGLLRAAIDAGIAKLNISSRVGRALAAGIRAAWQADEQQLDPRRFLGSGRDAVARLAAEYFALTGSAGRAGPSAASTAAVTAAAGTWEPE